MPLATKAIASYRAENSGAEFSKDCFVSTNFRGVMPIAESPALR